jgi:hypothetical protein
MKTNTLIALFCSLVLLPTLGMANQVQLSFLPPSQNVPLNGTLQVGLGISLLNIGGPPSLGTYDVDVAFDPAILGFSSVSFGDPVLGDQLDIFGLGNIQSSTPGTGTVNAFELSLDSSADLDTFQAGDFTLFVLTFSALNVGTSPLNLNVNALGDAVGAPVSFTSENGGVKVIAIASEAPEPGTIFVGLGLGAVILGRRLIRISN